MKTYAHWSRQFQRFLKNKSPQKLSTADVKEYAKGLFTDAEAQPMIMEKRSRGTALDVEIDKLQQELENLPSEATIRQRAENITKARSTMSQRIKETVLAHYQQERKLLESVFEGRDAEGRRLGVYLRKEDGKWLYELRGNIPWVNQRGELYSERTARLLGIDSDDSYKTETASQASTPIVCRS